MKRRWVALATLILVMFATGVARPWRQIPAAWNPWEPLQLEHAMNPVTRWKLGRLASAPEQCVAVLDEATDDRLDYVVLRDYLPVKDCPLRNVVQLRRTSTRFSAPFTVTCPLAVAWLLYEQRLQRLAEVQFGSAIGTVEHLGSFACRNVYHRASGRRSEHATASALDIAAFVLTDGTRVRILDDWDSAAAPGKAAFLHDTHAAACA